MRMPERRARARDVHSTDGVVSGCGDPRCARVNRRCPPTTRRAVDGGGDRRARTWPITLLAMSPPGRPDISKIPRRSAATIDGVAGSRRTPTASTEAREGATRQPRLHRRMMTINIVDGTTPSICAGTASNTTTARRSQTAVSAASASPDQVAPTPLPATPPTATPPTPTPPTATTSTIGDEHAPPADTGTRAWGGGPSALTIRHTPRPRCLAASRRPHRSWL